MLSYMVPTTALDDKPPQIPVKTTRLKLIYEDDHNTLNKQFNNNNNTLNNNNNNIIKKTIIKTHSKQSNISTDSSASSLSSLSSDLPITHMTPNIDKIKNKTIITSNNNNNNVINKNNNIIINNNSLQNNNSLPNGGNIIVNHLPPFGITAANPSSTTTTTTTIVTSIKSNTPSTLNTSTVATKSATLKRVSFGSSKGSMVETLIYESPLQEEPETSPNTPANSDITDDGSTTGGEGVNVARSKVRVSFFECEKPSLVSSPEPSFLDDLVYDAMATTLEHDQSLNSLQRQTSTDSGWDNPFRPDGDLSKEADEIVQLIKGGKPITPTLHQNGITLTNGGNSPIKEEIDGKKTSTPISNYKQQTQQQNGSKNNNSKKPLSPGQVEIEHGKVDASQVEHVVIKKKPKCKCCTIQ